MGIATEVFRLPSGGGSSTPYQTRSLWLQQALDSAELAGMSPALEGSTTADVCILGGGFVGLWTALELKRREPTMRIVLLDADICGGGASGRNTGQILPLWSKIKTLKSIATTDDAVSVARRSEQAVEEIESFARRRGVDVGLRRSGWLWLASSSQQLTTWDGLLQTCARLGVEPFVRVSVQEARERSGSPVYLGGVLMPGAAMMQPAVLARELRRAVIDEGVEIHEQTPVTRVLVDRDGVVLQTPRGSVSAAHAVLALGGWSRGVPQLGKVVIAVGSEIIATEPIGERLDASGWTGFEPVTNARLTLRYTRRTDDGRVIFGRAGTSLGFGRRVHPVKFEQNAASTRQLQNELPRFVPAARDARVTHSWIGPVDRSQDGLPVFGRLGPGIGRVVYATGFSGNGVGPSLLASKSLTSMVLEVEDEWSGSPLVARRMRRFPPEPVRFLGGELVRHALTEMEDREEESRRVPRTMRLLAGLAPGGLAKDDTRDPDD